ncbi:sesquipedalian-1 isoform X2 [Uranotaenia lowii]|uniref:sesquipedalian-1 isoform X2 n=1 Tax=Uranotaenia lowii TaxID=190385 RepID=UPI00247A51EA|nr:sesquipedalian-1 isoform X2 [Uranotaenia lowii]
MKINEKNLCMFATTPPVDLEGWLNKRGEINKSWQRRWFVLKGNLLFYFERKGDREPLGMIILEGCTVELAEEGEQYCFQIMFHGPNNRTYFLSTESQSNMEQWMKALTCAGYDYMKLMVAELQRQLDEIEGCKEQIPEQNVLLTTVPPRAPPRRQNPFNRPAPPTEFASNAGKTTPSSSALVSPQVTRKAPAPPPSASSSSSTTTPAAPQSHLKSPSVAESTSALPGGTGLSRSASGASARSGHSNNSAGSQNMVLNVDLLAISSGVDEFGFDRMHQLLGAPVLADLHARKMTMEQGDQPLIMF